MDPSSLNILFVVGIFLISFLATWAAYGTERGLEPYLLGMEIVVSALAFVSDWVVHICKELIEGAEKKTLTGQEVSDKMGLIAFMFLLLFGLLLVAIRHERDVMAPLLSTNGSSGVVRAANSEPRTSRRVSVTSFLFNNLVGGIALAIAVTAKIMADSK